MYVTFLILLFKIIRENHVVFILLWGEIFSVLQLTAMKLFIES